MEHLYCANCPPYDEPPCFTLFRYNYKLSGDNYNPFRVDSVSYTTMDQIDSLIGPHMQSQNPQPFKQWYLSSVISGICTRLYEGIGAAFGFFVPIFYNINEFTGFSFGTDSFSHFSCRTCLNISSWLGLLGGVGAK